VGAETTREIIVKRERERESDGEGRGEGESKLVLQYFSSAQHYSHRIARILHSVTF